METFAATIGPTVYALFVDSQRVGIRRYEDGGSVEVAQHLTPEVLGLLQRGCALLDSLVRRYETPEPEPGDALAIEFSETQDLLSLGAVTARAPSAVLADVAFMAHSELRQHLQQLQRHRGDSDVQEMISDCGSALRAIQKSLYAIEHLLCELEEIAHFLPSHLATSLKVRRHYRKLWTFANLMGDVTASTVRAALRGAGTRISILAGSDVYSLLREDDRFYIRELQVRILEWLRSGTDNGAAIRIWQDFALFVEILRQVNLREELVRHDRRVIMHALDLLVARGDDALAEVIMLLRPAMGVDDVLDEALQSQPSTRSLMRELQRVTGQLGAADRGVAHSVAL